MESEEAGTRLALNEAEANRDRLAKRLREVEKERQQILQETRAEAEEELNAIREELRRARRKIRDAESRTMLKKIGKEVEQIEEEQIQPVVPHKKVAGQRMAKKKAKETRRTLQKGDTVQVKSLNARGEVMEINDKEAVVAIGRMQMRADYHDLEFKGRPDPEPESEMISEPVTAPDIELDIRGRRVEDGLAELEKYLDSAFLARLPWVRIIHGKGTGKLRMAVRESLGKNQFVNSWEEGKDGEGGAGVTVAKLIERE
jgi:DNA mismatch repair protein MutS2